jgi:poly(A) polymerase
MLKRIRDLLTRRGKQPATEVLPDRPRESTVETLERPEVQHGPRVVHQPIARTDLDADAVKIVHRLTRFDHAAYLVGGCVRDLLLDHKPKDFDIATSATPRQIKRLFRNCRIIGRRFRLAPIYFQNGKVIEVATFRAQDDEGTGGERGAEGGDLLIRDDNQFGTMEEDALRRDFTINSLFYDVNKGTVLDHADGLGDLRRRLVRTIGDPTIRFKEDPIRILRAIKFAARLDFEIETGTLDALKKTRGEIPKAAAPRILEELNRFCRGGAARRSFELMRDYDVFDVIAPGLAKRYKSQPASWDLLFKLLEGFDRHTQDGIEVTTGQILAALLLPVLMTEFGHRRSVAPSGLATADGEEGPGALPTNHFHAAADGPDRVDAPEHAAGRVAQAVAASRHGRSRNAGRDARRGIRRGRPTLAQGDFGAAGPRGCCDGWVGTSFQRWRSRGSEAKEAPPGLAWRRFTTGRFTRSIERRGQEGRRDTHEARGNALTSTPQRRESSPRLG